MRVLVDTHGDTPPSRQIANAILDALAAGELTAGDRLPSVRSAHARIALTVFGVTRSGVDNATVGSHRRSSCRTAARSVCAVDNEGGRRYAIDRMEKLLLLTARLALLRSACVGVRGSRCLADARCNRRWR